MKNNNNIRIRTILWDLQVTDVHTASVWQNIASEFSASLLPSILEKTLGKYQTDQHFVIDKIELDLDIISEEDELEDRLSGVLREALNLRTNKQLSDIAQLMPLEPERPLDSVLTEMKFYLVHGFFRWTLVNDVHTFKKSVIQFLIQMDTDRFAEWLNDAIRHESQVLRFLQFFSGEEIEKMVSKALAFHELVITFQKFVTMLLERMNYVQNTHRFQMTEKIIRYRYLLYLLGNRDVRGEKEFVIGWWHDLKKGGVISPSLIELMYGTMKSAITFSNESVPGRADFRDFAKTILGSRQASDATTYLPDQRQTQIDEKVFFVKNAGIVLLYPWLKKLFIKFKLIDEANSFYGYAERMMAAYAIQCVATGQSKIFDYELVLNKILCGFNLNDPVFVPDEAFLYDVSVSASNFIEETIQGWDKIKNTSVGGFRTSFLFRPGKLVEEEMNWLLIVERRGLDVLLETLPYPISVIKLPWMNKPLFVQW